MKGSAWFLLSLTALALGAPPGVSVFDPKIQLEANFDTNNVKGASGMVNVQSGAISLAAARSEGKVALGMGLQEKGTIALGNFGKISVKGFSTLDGQFEAVIDSELLRGQRAFNPFQITVVSAQNGLLYSGSTNLGYLSGTYEGSTGNFAVRLNTDGYLTANAHGQVKNQQISWKSYNASINLGIASAAVNLDDQMRILDYELGSTVGVIHGAVHTNQITKEKRYRAGLNLGIVRFEMFLGEDKSKTYTAELDTGMASFAYNADPKNEVYNWNGDFNLANMAINYAHNNEGLTIGGRIQIGQSVVSVQRDPKGKFTVNVNRGRMIE